MTSQLIRLSLPISRPWYRAITLDECHAWFHLYGLRSASRNGAKQAKNSKWSSDPRFPTRPLRPLGHRDWCHDAFLTLWEFRHMNIYTRQYEYLHAAILYVYWNRMSDKICISVTNTDVIYGCLLDFAWTHQTTINLINALSCVHLIDMSGFCKSLKREHNIARFPFLTARRSPYEWNQA